MESRLAYRVCGGVFSEHEARLNPVAPPQEDEILTPTAVLPASNPTHSTPKFM